MSLSVDDPQVEWEVVDVYPWTTVTSNGKDFARKNGITAFTSSATFGVHDDGGAYIMLSTGVGTSGTRNDQASISKWGGKVGGGGTLGEKGVGSLGLDASGDVSYQEPTSNVQTQIQGTRKYQSTRIELTQ
jgi:hypothetical protein